MDTPGNRKKIILQTIKKNKNYLFGSENGKNERDRINLSFKDFDDFEYLLVIPDNIMSISPSYFIGLFSKSLKRIGIEHFRKKYKFQFKLKEIEYDIEEGIEWSLD